MATQIPPFSNLLKEAIDAFEEIFKNKPEIAACAPGIYTYRLKLNF